MKNISLLAIALLGVSIMGSAQNPIYVHASAVGANNGTSWADAFINLQTALQSVQTGSEVWVAEGVYLPTADNNRDTSFNLPNGAQLYGGFNGTETSLDQRNWQAHPTILSGDIGVSSDSADNSYTILFLDNPDSLTKVDGFVFRFGNAGYPFNDRAATSRSRSGGAIYIMADWEGFATVSNCRFERNLARNHGGAVYVNGAGSFAAAPTFKDCVFERNIAGQDGGGVARVGNSDLERPDFVGCVFRENRASRHGGGLYFQDANVDSWLDIQGCTFVKNHGLNQGGGATLRIGRPGGGTARIKDCRFEENNTPSGSGALSLLNQSGQVCQEVQVLGCVFVRSPSLEIQYDLLGSPSSALRIQESRFEDHFSYSPIFAGDIVSSLIIEKDTFVNVPNATIIASNGGEITHIDKTFFTMVKHIGSFNSSSDMALVTNSVIENSIFTDGITNISMPNNPLIFKSCSFINCDINCLAYGSGAPDVVREEFQNCLFKYCNISYTYSGTVDVITQVEYCFFDNNMVCETNLNDLFTICGPNNLYDLNPLFRDTANHDYSLLPCSPLINAGSNAAAMGILTDIAGNPRIQGGTVDIGAYESPAFSLAASPEVQPACVGSSNGSIAITPVFGCEPYTYKWLPDAGNGPQLNGLAPGNYLLTITDGSGRQILDTVQVASAPLPVLNPVVTDVQCGTTLGGSISANVSNGSAPYHYEWLPAGLPDTSYLSQLSPLTYHVSVVDANGCQDSASANISLLGLLTLMVDGQGISCFGETDGWLSATPLTGASPFDWEWQGWAGTDSIAQPLGQGMYAVTVSDVFGCTAAFTFPPMNQPDSLYATVGTQDQTNLSMPNGAAVVTTISGGMGPFGFDWSTGSTQQAIAGLTAGDYIVTVTDKNGCEVVVEVVVDLMVTATEEIGAKAFVIYPNPAADWLKVAFPQPVRGGRLELSDASGRVLSSIQLTAELVSYTMDLSGLPSGSYFVTVLDERGKERFAAKMLKQ